MKIDLQIITSDMKNTMGVYGIRQISTGLFYYIGQSLNVWNRWLVHKKKSVKDTATEEYKAFHKLLLDNPDDFEPVLLYKLSNLMHVTNKQRLHHRLVKHEKMLIDEYIAAGHPIATKPEYQNAPMTHKHHSDETKTKISAKMTGENNPAKRQDVRDKMSAAKKGKYKGENNPCFGSTFTWMHDDKHNYRVPKGQEEQKEKEGLLRGIIRRA